MSEYRPLSEDEADAFRRITSDAFDPASGPGTPDSTDDRPEVGERRGVFDDGEPVAVCRHTYLRARARGAWRDAACLAAVATPPEHRRQGHARTLLAESLREYRERSVPISLLWPFDHGFYGAYGWGRANDRAAVELPVEELPVDTDRSVGRMRPVDPDESDRLDPVYETHAEDYALSLDRTPDWWERQILTGHGTDPYVYASERDGDVRGYVVYSIDDDGESFADRTLSVDELAFVDRDAYHRLLAFLRDHDAQVRTVELSLPTDAPVFEFVGDPAAVEYRIEPGPMVRLVDVQTALSGLPTDDANGQLALRVKDPLADWNDGTVLLDATGDTLAVEPIDTSPDATIGIGTLSRLFAGSVPVSEARISGSLDCGERAGAFLDTLFPERRVYLREFF